MNDFESSSQGFRFYECLMAMVDMISSWSLSQGFRCYEQLRVMVNMNDFGLLAQGSECYEVLMVVDVINNLGLWMIVIILGHEPMSLNALNNLR